jgi:hypothetical protein
MQDLAWLLIPGLVTALAVVMIVGHRRAWEAQRGRRLEPGDQRYLARRYRRRMQASSLLALLGPALFVGHRISPQQLPRLFVGYWIGVALVTIWIGLLAAGDALATGQHFSLKKRRGIDARARLQAELAQARASMISPAEDTLPADES